jgi:membrane-associated protease RseP (regulator of RpoE activity)
LDEGDDGPLELVEEPPAPKDSRQAFEVPNKPQAIDRDGEIPTVPTEQLRRAALGIALADGGIGAWVADVIPDGPADRAGVRPGDSILCLNGHRVRDPEDVSWHIAHVRPDEQVVLRVQRLGYHYRFAATLDTAANVFGTPRNISQNKLHRDTNAQTVMRPNFDMLRQLDLMQQRIDTLEQEVRMLRTKVTELQEARSEESKDKPEPTAGAIQDF